MIRLIAFTRPSPASSDTEVGMVARIHRLPSSSFGRNSNPSERVHSAHTTSSTAIPPSVSKRLASARRISGT